MSEEGIAQPLDRQTSIDGLVLATMRRIQPLLRAGLSRERLSTEISASLSEFGLDRCAIWLVEGEVAHRLFLFDRSASHDHPDRKSLRKDEEEWLFRCAGSATVLTDTEAGRVRCAVPIRAPEGRSNPCLMVVEHAAPALFAQGEPGSRGLQFMGNFICSLLCYARD